MTDNKTSKLDKNMPRKAHINLSLIKKKYKYSGKQYTSKSKVFN